MHVFGCVSADIYMPHKISLLAKLFQFFPVVIDDVVMIKTLCKSHWYEVQSDCELYSGAYVFSSILEI